MNTPKDMTLVEETRVGKATIRVYRGGYPMRRVEYREDGRIWSCQWDGRDDGDTQYIGFGHWDVPADRPITGDEEARILAAVLPALGGRVAQQKNGVDVYHALGGRGYMIKASNTAPITIEYYEPGRTLHLYEDEDLTNLMKITLRLPETPVWSYPPGQPVEPGKWAEILERLRRSRDTGIDSDFSVFIVVPKTA